MPLSLEADYHHQGIIDLPENSCSSQSVHKAATGVMAGARKHEENTCRCSSTPHLRERQRKAEEESEREKGNKPQACPDHDMQSPNYIQAKHHPSLCILCNVRTLRGKGKLKQA